MQDQLNREAERDREAARRRAEPIIDDDNRGRGPYGFDLRGEGIAAGYIYGEFTPPDEDSWVPGITFGIGAGHQTVDGVEGPHASLGVGRWRDQDGHEQRGARVNAGVISAEGSDDEPRDQRRRGGQQGDVCRPPGWSPDTANDAPGVRVRRGGGGLLQADGGIYADDQTLTWGAQANAAEVDIEIGTDTARDHDTDTNVRVGVSEGAGAATRIHYGDEDGDGVREMGIGGDLFFLSGDVRSEYIGQAYNAAWNRLPRSARNWWDDTFD